MAYPCQDIVQFSSDIYYCSEAEGNVRVEAGKLVQRLQPKNAQFEMSQGTVES